MPYSLSVEMLTPADQIQKGKTYLVVFAQKITLGGSQSITIPTTILQGMATQTLNLISYFSVSIPK